MMVVIRSSSSSGVCVFMRVRDCVTCIYTCTPFVFYCVNHNHQYVKANIFAIRHSYSHILFLFLIVSFCLFDLTKPLLQPLWDNLSSILFYDADICIHTNTDTLTTDHGRGTVAVWAFPTHTHTHTHTHKKGQYD